MMLASIRGTLIWADGEESNVCNRLFLTEVFDLKMLQSLSLHTDQFRVRRLDKTVEHFVVSLSGGQTHTTDPSRLWVTYHNTLVYLEVYFQSYVIKFMEPKACCWGFWKDWWCFGKFKTSPPPRPPHSPSTHRLHWVLAFLREAIVNAPTAVGCLHFTSPKRLARYSPWRQATMAMAQKPCSNLCAPQGRDWPGVTSSPPAGIGCYPPVSLCCSRKTVKRGDTHSLTLACFLWGGASHLETWHHICLRLLQNYQP